MVGGGGIRRKVSAASMEDRGSRRAAVAGAESLQPAAQRVRGEWSFSGVGGHRKYGRAILQILPKRAFP